MTLFILAMNFIIVLVLLGIKDTLEEINQKIKKESNDEH